MADHRETGKAFVRLYILLLQINPVLLVLGIAGIVFSVVFERIFDFYVDRSFSNLSWTYRICLLLPFYPINTCILYCDQRCL